jgi:hypothetical protein
MVHLTIRCDGPGGADRFAAALVKARGGKKPGEQVERRGSDVVVKLGYENARKS